MKKVDHPHCVKLYEVIDDPSARKIYMVLEYVEGGPVMGDECTELPPDECIPSDVMRHFMRDCLLGLDFLHAMNIVHGDIKPSNLLATLHGDIKRV